MRIKDVFGQSELLKDYSRLFLTGLRIFPSLFRHFFLQRQVLHPEFREGKIIPVPVQLADERVEPVHRHQRHSFKDPDLLLDEHDDQGNCVLARDLLVELRPFPVLPDRVHQRGHPVPAARPPLALHKQGPAIPLRDDIVLPALPLLCLHGAEADRKAVLLEDEGGQPLEVLPDGSLGNSLECLKGSDLLEVGGVSQVPVLRSLLDGKTLPEDPRLIRSCLKSWGGR